MKHLIVLTITCMLLIGSSLLAEEQTEVVPGRTYVIIGKLIESQKSLEFYYKHQAMVVYPFNHENPIDLTLGMIWLAESGQICKMFGCHPSIGKCDFCGKAHL